MWQTTIKTWVWIEEEGVKTVKKGSLNFSFDSLAEASEFIETVRTHSDVITFELEYKAKAVQ